MIQLRLTLFLCLCICIEIEAQGADQAVRIVRDAYGVPHIYAQATYDLFYGYGYAVAQDRLFQLEMLKRTTTGTVAEVLGKDYVELDKQTRSGFDPKSIKRQLRRLRGDDADIFEGYAAGLNAWIDEINAKQAELLPAEFASFAMAPSRWTAYDVVMCFVGSILHRYGDFNEELTNLSLVSELASVRGSEEAMAIFDATLPLLDRSSPTTVPAEPPRVRKSSKLGATSLTRVVKPPLPTAIDASGQLLNLSHGDRQQHANAQLARIGLPGAANLSSASNVWLASSARLLDAAGVLVNGPQFGWSTPSYLYGVGLHGAGFDAVGNTLLAAPFLMFAHNGSLGWGSTAGFGDLVDLFELRLNPDNPEQFWRNGRYRSFQKRRESIAVRGEPSIEHLVYTSPYGPVIVRDLEANVAYAKKRGWAGREVETGLAWIELAKATSFASAREALSKVAANINFFYLDAAGNIGYTHAGRYPVRAKGHDHRLPAKGDGSMDWQGYLPFESNPYVHNPESGYLTNWNNRPSAEWPNSDLWWRRWSRASRVSLISEAIEARPRWSAESLWQINRKLAHADLNQPFLLPELTRGLDQHGSTPLALSAIVSLEQWDGSWMDRDGDGHFDGAGPAIMDAWLRDLLRRVLADDLGETHFVRFAAPGYPTESITSALAVSPGIKAIVANIDRLQSGTDGYNFFNGAEPSAVLAESFLASIALLQETHGSDLRAWNLKAHALTFRTYNFHGVPQADPLREQLMPIIMNRGSENNVFVARDGRITGRDVVPPGQSGFANTRGEPSPHYSDQLDLYGSYQLKALPHTPAEVSRAARSEIKLKVRR